MNANIARMRERLALDHAVFRPHLKTAKCIEIAKRLADVGRPVAVSTLSEATIFADAGYSDILYAVGLAPAKLGCVADLRARGVDLKVVIDSVEQARACSVHSGPGTPLPVLVEIDSDGTRAGVEPASEHLLEIAKTLRGGAMLSGVMTHAGGSYSAIGPKGISRAARAEIRAAASSAHLLRANGFPCPIVSVGSTPTALEPADLSGVTEVRAGVFVFFDLVMAGIGVCETREIALSVLASVIGHRRGTGEPIIDAGWSALSADRGTATQPIDQGFGVVCDINGNPFEDLIVVSTSQEHGILGRRPGSTALLPELAVGSLVRILPNHACATAGQHENYVVIPEMPDMPLSIWKRYKGW